MEKYEPKYMVHGHVHQEYSSTFLRERVYDRTLILNAYKRFIFEI